MAVTKEARAQQGMPRHEDVAAATQLKERQVGSSDTNAVAQDERGAEPSSPAIRPASAGAVAGFLLGVLMGRHSKKGPSEPDDRR